MAKIDENVKVMMLKGETGSSIKSIDKTATSGLVDTYTVTLTDGTKSNFTVTNGKNGIDGADFDTFEIGGRNLLRGSKDFSGAAYRALTASYTDETVSGVDCTVLSSDNTAGSTYVNLAEWRLPGVGTAGVVYTASFWFKGSGECALYFYGPEGFTGVSRAVVTINGTTTQYASSDGQAFFIQSGSTVSDWTRCTVVYTLNSVVGSTTEKFLTWQARAGSTLSIALPKLERGTKPSDWTPAPEDKADEADLQSLSTKVAANASGISKNASDISTLSALSTLYSDSEWRVCVKCGFVWVYCYGVSTGGGSWDYTDCPYTLPVEYRPHMSVRAPAVTSNGGSYTGYVSVTSEGEISVCNFGGTGSTDARSGTLCYPIGI